ncbi:hypothetical protein AB0M80_34630 [Amycolatopsis sp. NPDC051045]|uniref:hypothetical protein n=1 Tax=Amycolatopsis sp. NPDC051045 TaxID=3156922 RepID=UPI003438F054
MTPAGRSPVPGSGPTWLTGWQPGQLEECLAEFADDRASAAHWRQLGQLYVEKLKPEEILHG